MSPRYIRSGKISPHRAASLAADAVAMAHLIVAMAVMIIGEFTELFRTVSSDHGGINFILWYIDRPVYSFMGAFVSSGPDLLTLYLFALTVVLVSSVLYGLCCYVITRLFIGTIQ